MRQMITVTFQRFAAFLNACLLAGLVAAFFPDDESRLADVLYVVLTRLLFAVPVISMFALVPPKAKTPGPRN